MPSIKKSEKLTSKFVITFDVVHHRDAAVDPEVYKPLTEKQLLKLVKDSITVDFVESDIDDNAIGKFNDTEFTVKKFSIKLAEEEV